MSGSLTYDLHVLTARLDRAADRILQGGLNVSYRRFLALLLVGDGALTQRELADRLGVTEPSTSRMVGVLAAERLLDVAADPAGGNRRRLTLTPAGKARVQACREVLEGRFAQVVARSGVSYADYAEQTRRLVAALDDEPAGQR